MSLIAHYELDGNADDSSGNGYHATKSTGSYVSGVINQAGYFSTDGTSDFDVTTDILPSGNTITITFWANVHSSLNNSLFDGDDSSGNRVVNIHLLYANGNTYWDCGNSGSSYDRIYALNPVGYNEWHHWAFVKDAITGYQAIYLDGSEWISSNTMTNTIGDATSWTQTYAIEDFVGDLDDIRIYSQALSARDIGLLQSTPPSLKQENEIGKQLALWYPFDKPSGNDIVADSSGNGNIGSLFSDVVWGTSGGVAIDGNTLTKTAGTSSWDSGALSEQSFSKDCFIEWSMDYVDSSHGAEMVGLNHDHSTWDYNDIDYSIYTHYNGDVDVYENGSNQGRKSTWDLSSWNVFRVEVKGSTVYYLQNGSVIHTSSTTHGTSALYADCSMHCHGAQNSIINTKIGYLSSSNVFPQWVRSSYPGGFGYYSFDGSGKIDTSYTPRQEVISACVWATLDGTLSGQDWPCILAQYYTGGDNIRIAIGYSVSDGKMFAGKYSGNNWNRIFDNNTVDYSQFNFYSATYDGSTLRFYINRNLSVSASDSDSPVSSDNYMQIGARWDAHNYPDDYWNGKIADVRIYETLLTQSQVEQLYKQRASMDDVGNLWVRNLIESGPIQKLVDYTDWEVGTDGNQSSYDGYTWNANGSASEQEIIEDIDPWGRTAKMWKCIPDSNSGADGGWNKNYPADELNRYRQTVFVKRTSSTNGSTYHGCHNGGNTLNLDGSSNGNPYFWSGDPPSLNQWYLLVGVVHPSDHGSDDWGLAGVYDLNGVKQIDGTEYKMEGGATVQEMRDYLYYCTDTSERQYFLYPRVDVMDGTEPSIEALCAGMNSWIDQHYEYTKGSPFKIASSQYASEIVEGDRNGVKMKPNKILVNELIEY